MTYNTRAWRHRGALLVILLGGFALRLYRLGADSLWYDETVSAHLASKSILGLVAHTARDIHPPGYYLLLHAWTYLGGDSEFALAFFSVAFGVLLIPLTYALARRLSGRMAALWAALLVVMSPFNLWYSQEVRMYTLGALLGLVTLWCGLNAVARDSIPRYTYLIGYLLAAAAGLYVLYYFGFLLVTLNLLIIGYLLLNRRFRRLGLWLLAQAAVLILYLPWLPIAWRQATHPPVPPWRSFIPLPAVVLEAWTNLSLGGSVQPIQVWPILLVTGVVFLLGLRPRAYSTARSPIYPSALYLVSYTFGPLLLIQLVSLVTPLYHVRYLFTYAPAFYIVLGAGLAWLTRRAWPLAAAAALALLAGSAFSIYELHTNPRYAADDFRSAVGFIAERWRPGDVVLINAGYAYPGFLYYYDGPIADRVRLSAYQSTHALAAQTPDRPLLLSTGTIDGDRDLGWGDPNSDFYATNQAETAAALEQVAHDFPRIWMLRIYDTVTDSDGFIRAWLAANTTPFEDQLFTGESSMRVQGFMSTYQPPLSFESEVPLEAGMSLLGWEIEPIVQAGDPLDVVLWWRADASPSPDDQGPAGPFAVSLKLWATAKGNQAQLAAQNDEWPVGSLLLTPDWPPGQAIRHPMRLWLPDDLPPGEYRLEVEMYDPVTVQPLSRLDGREHTIPLGPVTVLPNPEL